MVRKTLASTLPDTATWLIVLMDAWSKEVAGESLLWTGPTVNPAYYVPGSAQAVPTYKPRPGDDRISPSLAGTLL